MSIKTSSFIIVMMALLISPNNYATDIALGSLFTSAEERRALNALRQQDLLQNVSKNSANKTDIEKTFAPDIVVNGIVKKANGKQIVWINGKRVENKKNIENVRIYQGPDKLGRILVGLPGKHAMHLKPGQRLHGDSGKVSEDFARQSSPDKTEKESSVVEDSASAEL